MKKEQAKKLFKEHEKRMKKYRKIWKEQGCMHWRDSSN
jgi:hypothetical protein